jgi:hypothetical protein
MTSEIRIRVLTAVAEPPRRQRLQPLVRRRRWVAAAAAASQHRRRPAFVGRVLELTGPLGLGSLGLQVYFGKGVHVPSSVGLRGAM